MIFFLGDSHAVHHLREGARKRGVPISDDPSAADVIFISQDTQTSETGERDLEPIRTLVNIMVPYNKQLVLTSQVPPGFTRSLGLSNIYHQAETLRIKDAETRAYSPDYIAVGGPQGISKCYAEYLLAFHCPVLRMSWEDAEFSKIAVNMMLAAQVDYANEMSKAAKKMGADWKQVCRALHADKRIGPEA